MIEPSELKGKREQLRKEDQQLFKQLKKMPG
jgi:hypothetical protein